jgi:hypothetical protein
MTINKDMWTNEEIAKEVNKLINYAQEMKILTKYTGGEVPRFQMLSIWAYLTLKGSE